MDVAKIARCLIPFCHPSVLSCLVLLLKEEETEAPFTPPHPVESSVQICQSACPCRSLVRCTPLYSFVDSLNRSFHPRGPDIFHPPLTLNPRCTSGDAQSPGDFFFFFFAIRKYIKQTDSYREWIAAGGETRGGSGGSWKEGMRLS